MSAARTLLRTAAFALLLTPALFAQEKPLSDAEIKTQFDLLQAITPATPTPVRAAAVTKLALQIRAIAPGPTKVRFADQLCRRATPGEIGRATLQETATTLSTALAESPIPAKGDKIPPPYLELAKLVRYEGVTTTLEAPQLTQATAQLAANEADIQKADFTLLDTHNKKISLSQFKGKIVLVNFWTIRCATCGYEMEALDTIYNHFKAQDVVILSITDEPLIDVGLLEKARGFTYPLLVDPMHKAYKQFHVDVNDTASFVPVSFVFDREGKLSAIAPDIITQKQIFAMLSKAGLKPQK